MTEPTKPNENEEQRSAPEQTPPMQPIVDMGAVTTRTARGTVYCLTVVGQIEGHSLLPNTVKTTKYEHVLPLLAALAAEELREKYPHAKIMTIDTYAASLGEGLQVLEAAELLRAGRSFEEVGDRILARRPHMCQFFTVDDLNYLKRGGRISGAAALVGTMLGIKPLLRGDETGHIVSCGKVRGNKKAYAELADYFDKRALDKTARIGIAHADNCEGTDYLLGLLRERGFTGECLEVYYEPVTGAHVGPGTVALFFQGIHR